MRQRLFPVPRHVRHGLPFRVFAPHRPCEEGESVGSGDCMGLTFDFKLTPTPSRLLLDQRSDRGLSAGMDAGPWMVTGGGLVSYGPDYVDQFRDRMSSATPGPPRTQRDGSEVARRRRQRFGRKGSARREVAMPKLDRSL